MLRPRTQAEAMPIGASAWWHRKCTQGNGLDTRVPMWPSDGS
jgi:hypothetical protein